MNNEYLWDKTGNDAEIRRLEEQLEVFRFQATEPPRVEQPATVATRRYGLAWAFGLTFASLAVLAGAVLWSMLQNVEQRNEVTGSDTISRDLPSSVEAKALASNLSTAPVSMKISSAVKAVGSTHTRSAKRSLRVAPTKQLAKVKRVELTPEERAAYDQVVLALAITSSKLKMVQDKVNGDNADRERQ